MGKPTISLVLREIARFLHLASISSSDTLATVVIGGPQTAVDRTDDLNTTYQIPASKRLSYTDVGTDSFGVTAQSVIDAGGHI